MKVLFCCGMGRSGGTRQYQLAAAVVQYLGLGRGIGFGVGLEKGRYARGSGWVVCKKEPPAAWAINMADLAISIIRDPRDVVCSLWRWGTEQGRYDTFPPALKNLAEVLAAFDGWEPHCDHISRYETFDPAEECRIVANLLGRDLPRATAEDIAARYSVAANRKRMVQLERAGRWMDVHSMLTRAHIGPQAGASVWQNTLSPEQVQQVQEAHGKWMEAHGYSLLDCVGQVRRGGSSVGPEPTAENAAPEARVMHSNGWGTAGGVQ